MRHTRKNRKVGGSKTRSRSFKKSNNKKKVIIGLIFANWCGHCKALKPEWDKMKNKLAKGKRHTKIRGGDEAETQNAETKPEIVEIEADDSKKDEKMDELNSELTSQKVEANGYPTIFKIVNNSIEYYSGERNAEALYNWATNNEANANNNIENDKLSGGYILRVSQKKKKKSKRI
jgi:thiol-disulfide isomerase/thioredoxin